MSVSKAFYTDWSKAKKSIAQAKKNVTVVRLTKSGQPSKMASDTHRFDSEAEAYAYIKQVEDLNPGTNYQYQITTKE